MFPQNFELWLSGCHPSLIPQTPPVGALIVRKGIDALSALKLVQIFLPSMDVSTWSLGRADNRCNVEWQHAYVIRWTLARSLEMYNDVI